MLDDFVIVNLRPHCTDVMPTALTNLQWQTCLRRIAFLHRSELCFLQARRNVGLEIHHGPEAYQFLLEVICGLHSPLLGENAVMGQFRTFRASAKFTPTAWGRFLRGLMTDLVVDARYVRHHHLQGLGSQSYGSLIRRHVKGGASVAVLGAGSLAQEILPWLTNVRVFYRNQHHARDLQYKHPQIQIEQFRMADVGWDIGTSSLVIAAPIAAAEIDQWLALQGVTFSPILDLRGSAGTDRINSSPGVINLSELLASLHDERTRLEQQLVRAREEIAALTQQRSQQQDQMFKSVHLCA